MKKSTAAFLILLVCAVANGDVMGQDILLTPQNQNYIFTAGSEGAQTFLLNPAYLAIDPREGAFDAYYFSASRSQVNPPGSFHDLGIFGQSGKFGIAYRNAADQNNDLNEYSFGLGLGNYAGGIGFAFTYLNIAGLGSRWLPSVGVLASTSPYVSIGGAYHNFDESQLGLHRIRSSASLGIGVRPFGNDFLTLNGDVIFPSQVSPGYKAGVSIEPIPGLQVYGIYDAAGYSRGGYVVAQGAAIQALPSYLWGNSVSIGISFNFGSHIHVEGASSHQDGAYAATYTRVELSSEELKTILPGSRVAEITIGGRIPDAREAAFLFSKSPRTLLDYVDEIKKCADDNSIKALILKIYPFSMSERFLSLSGETQELADAVEDFRSKGKEVDAYLADDSGVNELYLASAADRIYMQPSAFIAGYGSRIDLIRLKGLFDKLHIAWNEMTEGKFKSTFHTLYTDSATPDQAALIQGLVDDIYSQMLKEVESNRHIQLADSVKADIAGIVSARDAAAMNLIDGVSYYDQFKKKMLERLSRSHGSLSEVDPWNIRYRRTEWGEKPEIAVIGIYGTITTGKSSLPLPIPIFGGDRTTGSETVVQQIKSAAENDNIKAIVLRVNSGGGSGLASDEIYNAVIEAEAKKPVVASFGNVAASGGYYVAVSARKIFAEPATVTGSIGVMIAFPVLTDFIEKDLGSNVEQYHSGSASSVLDPFRRWNERDMIAVGQFMNEMYAEFKTRVSEGRKLSLSRVDELAQGKVYTGKQAKDLGLTDDYGGLDKAIEYAADVAGISGGYRVKMFVVPGFGLGSIFRAGAELFERLSD